VYIYTLTRIEPSPEAVTDRAKCPSLSYWLRMDDGNYRQMRSRELRYHAKVRGYGKRIAHFICDANENCMIIRDIAGVQPGVYLGDHGIPFLVPEYLPAVAPLAAPDPPPEFLSIGEQLKRVIAEGRIEEVRPLRLRMMRIYREFRHAVEEPRQWGFESLLGKRPRGLATSFDDHRFMFRNEQGLIWTSQPYLDKVETLVPEVVGFAHQHGLAVTVSPKWSWHYPGKTMLIEWRRA
jgi:hypothetical protein